MSGSDRLISLLRGRGALGAAELRQRLDVSAATLSRWVRQAGGDVLRLGRGRATHYALPVDLPGLPARIPVYRVGEEGDVAAAGELVPLDDGGCWLATEAGDAVRLEGLPPFIHDMAPAGFLGRRFADHYPDLQLPARLQDWGDRHRLLAVARRGEDCPGDLIVGEESLERWLALRYSAVSPQEYPSLAVQSALGGAGSSAGGEQPKFTALVQGRHVLVKFSPGDDSPADRRWRDLLVCEGLALDALREQGESVPAWRIHDVGSRRFLEIERFDRIGARGRRGALTLAAIEDEWFDMRDNWTAAGGRLAQAGWLTDAEAGRLMTREAFAAAILNGDRHFGNIVFFADELQTRQKLALAPVFDMLPMDLAPRAGEVPPAPEDIQPAARFIAVWPRVCELARDYWRRVACDERVSAEMRATAERLNRLLGAA